MKINKSLHTRRKFLQSSAFLTGFSFAMPISSLVSAQTTGVESRRLSEQSLFVKGPDSNVLAVESSEGVVMVDGGHASWSGDLQQAVADSFPNRPLRALFNTHWHREQTGLNELAGTQGAEIIAHDNTRLWLTTDVWQRWSGITFPRLPEVALPATTVLDDGVRQFGEHDVYYGYLRNAHTDGDLWVYFEQENILVCGGFVSNGKWPVIDWWTGGYIGGMLDSFVTLLTVPGNDTKIVPGYGDIMTLDELKAQNQMYLTIFDRLHAMVIQSYSLEDILAEKPTAEFDAQMGDPTQFLTLAFHSFQGRYRDPQNFRLLNIP